MIIISLMIEENGNDGRPRLQLPSDLLGIIKGPSWQSPLGKAVFHLSRQVYVIWMLLKIINKNERGRIWPFSFICGFIF